MATGISEATAYLNATDVRRSVSETERRSATSAVGMPKRKGEEGEEAEDQHGERHVDQVVKYPRGRRCTTKDARKAGNLRSALGPCSCR